jgi:hypothetical protein
MIRIMAIITAGILAAGLMVVASHTSSVWAAVIYSGSSSSGSTTSAAGGGGTSHGSSSSVGDSTAGASGWINICGNTVKIIGACSSGEDN